MYDGYKFFIFYSYFSMGIYNLYASKKNKNQDFIYVKDGFSFAASIFGAFWYFFHGVWGFAFVIFSIGGACRIFQSMVSDLHGFFAYLIVALFSGLIASDAKQCKLNRDGYELLCSVYASCSTEARMKFFEKIQNLDSNNTQIKN